MSPMVTPIDSAAWLLAQLGDHVRRQVDAAGRARLDARAAPRSVPVPMASSSAAPSPASAARKSTIGLDRPCRPVLTVVASGHVGSEVVRSVHYPDRFSFPCRFAYMLAAPEHPEPERDRDDADHEQRPDVAPDVRRRRAVEDRAAGSRAARRSPARSSRSPASSSRQHRHRVVDAGDDEHDPLRHEAELRALLRRDQRQDGGHHPDPDERDRRDPEQRAAPCRSSRPACAAPKNAATTPKIERRADEPVGDREQAHPDQVHRPRERRHERVLDRPLPALPRDRLGEDLEDDPEVGPDHGADQQHRGQPVLLGGREARGLRDEDDRERVRDRPDEERELPHRVALDEVPVPLDDPVAGRSARGGLRAAIGSHAVTSSSSSCRSSSNVRPVAAKNASSSVSTP